MKKNIFSYKIKNRYLIYMILLSYIFGSFLGIISHNVLAGSTTTKIGFENGINNSPYNNGFLKTEKMNYFGSSFVVSTTTPSGLKDFRIGNSTLAGWGYFNFTYSGVLTKLKFNIRLDSTTAFPCWLMFGNKSMVSGYNYLLPLSDINKWFYILEIDAGSSGWLQYFDNGLVLHTITTGLSTAFYNEVNISIINNLGDTTMWSTGNAPITCSALNSTAINHGKKLDTLIIMSGSRNYFIDDMNITTSDSYSSSGGTCGYDMSSYDTIGTLIGSYSTSINTPSIYENYKIPLSTTIKGVELSVDKSMFTLDSGLNNYTLSINNEISTTADCFYQSQFNRASYILFWNTNVNLNNETVSFNFTHNKKLDVNNYWYVDNGGSESDLDFDGDISSGQGGITKSNCYYIFIYWIPFWHCDYWYKSINQFDFNYRFYNTGIQTTNLYNYTDSLGLFGYSYKNSTGYIYDLKDEKSIICSYTISDTSYSYTIELYKNGIQVLNNDFTYTCKYPGGTIGFSPNTTGTYQFKLKKVGYIYNVTAYVIGTLPNIYLTTNPIITDIGNSYSVIYKYYHLQNSTGYTSMFKSIDDINTHSKNIYDQEIGNNVSSYFTYQSQSSSSEYWRLFSFRNNFYSPIGKVSEHFIRIPNIVDNTIKCNVYYMNISLGNIENKSIIISGNHIFPGATIGIYVGNELKGYVGNSQAFTYFFVPVKSGVYTVDLRIIQDGIPTVLTTTPKPLTIQVIDSNGNIIPNNPLFFIQAPYSYFAGAFIVILLTLTPIIFAYMFKMNMSSIPQFLYLVFALLGFIIALLFGFFPMWSIIILILVGSLIIVIMWLQNKSA